MSAGASLRIIIVDFDGVLIESNSVKTHAFEQVFAKFPEHADAMMAFHRANVSLGRFYKFEHLLMLLGKSGDEDLLNTLVLEFSDRVKKEMQTVPLVPGAEEFLRRMSSRLPVYLASVTPDEELEVILARRGLRQWFRDVYGCPPWTKTKAIVHALDREGVKPDEAILIGDSAGDQQAAQETGVAFIARDSGLDFNAPTPLCFCDMWEITHYLENLLT